MIIFRVVWRVPFVHTLSAPWRHQWCKQSYAPRTRSSRVAVTVFDVIDNYVTLLCCWLTYILYCCIMTSQIIVVSWLRCWCLLNNLFLVSPVRIFVVPARLANKVSAHIWLSGSVSTKNLSWHQHNQNILTSSHSASYQTRCAWQARGVI